MLVFLLLKPLGLGDNHVPTFWLPLYPHTSLLPKPSGQQGVSPARRHFACLQLLEDSGPPKIPEDPKGGSPDFGLQYFFSVGDRPLPWIYFLDPPRGL